MNTTRRVPKRLPPSVVTEARMATLAHELQKAKAFCSMQVTDAGMATLANDLQPAKAN